MLTVRNVSDPTYLPLLPPQGSSTFRLRASICRVAGLGACFAHCHPLCVPHTQAVPRLGTGSSMRRCKCARLQIILQDHYRGTGNASSLAQATQESFLLSTSGRLQRRRHGQILLYPYVIFSGTLGGGPVSKLVSPPNGPGPMP